METISTQKVKLNYKSGDLIKVISPMMRTFVNVRYGDIGVVMNKTPYEWGMYNVMFPNGNIVMMLVEEMKEINNI